MKNVFVLWPLLSCFSNTIKQAFPFKDMFMETNARRIFHADKMNTPDEAGAVAARNLK